MNIWSDLSSVFYRPQLEPGVASKFDAEFRERCYRIATLVSIIGAVDTTFLSFLAHYGYGPAYAGNDWRVNIFINWISPAVLIALRGQSRRWYPWIICASITISNGQYIFHVLHTLLMQDHFTIDALKRALHVSTALSSVAHPHEAVDTFLQLQLRAVLITFWITALVPLPFAFATTLAVGFFVIYGAMMAVTGPPHDVVYALVRIGFIVFLGVMVAATVERRERRLFLAQQEVNAQLARNAARLSQYEFAQQAALKQISLLQRDIQARTKFMVDAFHDVRGPIGGISVGLDAYQQARLQNRQDIADSALDIMTKQCKAANKLAAELFDLSIYEQRQQLPAVTPVDVVGLLDEVVATFGVTAHAKGIDLRFFASGRRPLFVLSNQAELRRIMVNLVANAIKFTAPASPSTKTVRSGRMAGRTLDRKSGVVVGAMAAGSTVRIQVRDTGVGISESRLNEVWEYGKTTLGTNRERGNGLGLAMVRAICEILPQHGLRVNSVEGKGCEFSITVPRCEEPSTCIDYDAATGSRRSDQSLSGMTVLLVENDPATLEGETLILNLLGAAVSQADCVSSALEVSRRGGCPELLITDFHLDSGETGAHVITALRESWGSEIPAIVATADYSTVPIEAVASLGNVVVLRKAINDRSIFAAVARLFPLREPRPSAP